MVKVEINGQLYFTFETVEEFREELVWLNYEDYKEVIVWAFDNGFQLALTVDEVREVKEIKLNKRTASYLHKKYCK